MKIFDNLRWTLSFRNILKNSNKSLSSLKSEPELENRFVWKCRPNYELFSNCPLRIVRIVRDSIPVLYFNPSRLHTINTDSYQLFTLLNYKRMLLVVGGCWGFTTVLISKMMTVGVGHSRRYCNTGYDQSQGRRPSTLKCIGSISQRRYRAQPSVRN